MDLVNTNNLMSSKNMKVSGFIIKLKDKVLKLYDLKEVSLVQNNTNKDEALSALEVLGFIRKTAEKVVEKIARENPEATVEFIIKQALKNL